MGPMAQISSSSFCFLPESVPSFDFSPLNQSIFLFFSPPKSIIFLIKDDTIIFWGQWLFMNWPLHNGSRIAERQKEQ
jgi:hypothetical protein